MRKKLGLALGSGGARGVSHIGFLQALQEEDIRADFVTGCSMGAIIGALYCAGVDMQTVKERALKLKLSHVASLNVTPIHANGLFRMNKARKLLEEYMGNKSFDELDIPFCCVAVDMISGKLVKLSQGNVIDAVIASSSIPGAFTPVAKDGMILVDGGVLERVPTEELKQMGAETIVAIDVLGDLTIKKTPGNLVESLLRCIDIMDTRTTQRKKKSRARYIDLWIEPDLGAMDQYKVKNLKFAYEKGYESGKANAEKIKRLIGE